MTGGESEETDWSSYPDPVVGVRINDEGKYECKDCTEVLESTGQIRTTESERRRAVWECPECRQQYNI